MQAHEFLLDESDPERPLETMRDHREHVEGLLETRAIWFPDEATENWPHDTDRRMLTMLGAWEVPDAISGAGNGGTRYVNPRYVHAETYSDVETSCECGVTYNARDWRDQCGGAMNEDHLHSAECSRSSRRSARARLYLERVAWLKQQALLWNQQALASRRLGFTKRQAGRTISELPESYRDWYRTGRQLAANTMGILMGWGVDTDLIAAAYGCSPRTVPSYRRDAEESVLRERAPAALGDLRSSP